VVASDEDASTPGILRRAAALARPWAWPLPHVGLGALVPYEALLRSVLAVHPFADLAKVRVVNVRSVHRTSGQVRVSVGHAREVFLLSVD
jgi:hypothetical protein